MYPVPCPRRVSPRAIAYDQLQPMVVGSTRTVGETPGLSHMEFSMSRPCERRDPYGADSRFCTGAGGLFSPLRPGVMGPCVRRDDPLRDYAKPYRRSSCCGA